MNTSLYSGFPWKSKIYYVCVSVSGITRGVHVGSYVPSPYTSAPLKMYFLIAHNTQYTVYNTTTGTNKHDMTLHAHNIPGSAPVALHVYNTMPSGNTTGL